MRYNTTEMAAKRIRKNELGKALSLAALKVPFLGLTILIAIAQGQSRQYIGTNFSFEYPTNLQLRQNAPGSFSVLPPRADPSTTVEGTTIRVLGATQECYQFHESMHDNVVRNVLKNVPSEREVKRQYDERIGSRSETVGVYTSSVLDSAVDSGPAPNRYIASFCDSKEKLLVVVIYWKHPTSFNTAHKIIDSWTFGAAPSVGLGRISPKAGAADSGSSSLVGKWWTQGPGYMIFTAEGDVTHYVSTGEKYVGTYRLKGSDIVFIWTGHKREVLPFRRNGDKFTIIDGRITIVYNRDR